MKWENEDYRHVSAALVERLIALGARGACTAEELAKDLSIDWCLGQLTETEIAEWDAEVARLLKEQRRIAREQWPWPLPRYVNDVSR